MSCIKHFVRIRTTSQFNQIYSKSSKVWHNQYFVLFFQDSKEYNVGFVAGKKVGKAVQRNRAKRLLRALFIKNADLLKSGNYVFVAKPDILDESFLNLSNIFENTMKRTLLFNNFTQRQT